MPSIEIKDKFQFDKEQKNAGNKLVVVDFHAVWCGPCKAIAPVYESLSERYKANAVFLRVDVDQVKDVALEAKVEAMPTFIFYHKTAQKEVMKGADPKKLEATIQKLIEQYAKTVFQSSSGHSLLSGGGAAPAKAAPAPAPTPAPAPAKAEAPKSEGKGRPRNPWADPSFWPGKGKDGAATPSPSAAGGPGASANPWVAAGAPAPAGTPTAVPSQATPSSAGAAPSGQAAAGPSRAPATGNDARLKVNEELLNTLLAIDIPRVRAEKALIGSKNTSLDAALEWLSAHASDPDLDEPWQVVGAVPKPAGGKDDALAKVNESELDDDAYVLLQEMKAKRAQAASARAGGTTPTAGSGAAAVAPEESDEALMREAIPAGQKQLSEMTSEEKMAWLEKRRAEVKAKRAKEAMEREKDAERSRREMNKAAAELKERNERRQMEAFQAKKKRDEMESKANMARLREKIAADKERRKREAEAAAAKLAAAKAGKP